MGAGGGGPHPPLPTLLFLGGLDRFQLLLAEFLTPLQGPVADPFLEDFQVRRTLGVRAPQPRVHVARLPVLSPLPSGARRCPTSVPSSSSCTLPCPCRTPPSWANSARGRKCTVW